MELQKKDLKYMLESNPELDSGHILTILYNMLCAVNFIHTSGIIHRDLKPGNILIDDNCNIQICDFGLSRTMPVKTLAE
jgi:serine/threonine protein kinase